MYLLHGVFKISILKYMNTQTHEILLYYLYGHIDNPEQLKKEQREICTKLNLKGRIIISHEGINGTVGGLKQDTQAYINTCGSHPFLKDVQFKRSEGIENAFPKLDIKIRPELVAAKLGKEDIHPDKVTGKRITPDELHSWFKNNRDFVIVDMRNSYEFRFGRFKNSIDPGMRRFEEIKEKVSELEEFKNKTVLTVCTGGVRCEKASGYLVQKGFKDVYQLDGGMVSYMEKYPGQNYEGSLFVFDGRKVMHFNGEDHKPIASCDYCSVTCERFTNCANSLCNKKGNACYECVPKGQRRFCAECTKQSIAIF